MADGLDHFQRHELVGEQMQSPPSKARWRFAQTHRNPLRFLHAIEQLGRRRSRSRLTIQRLLKPFGDELLSQRLNHPRGAIKRLADLQITPRRTVHIRLQEDLSATDLLRSSLQLLNGLATNLTLFFREPNDLLLVHGNLLVTRRFLDFPPTTQPEPLALTTH